MFESGAVNADKSAVVAPLQDGSTALARYVDVSARFVRHRLRAIAAIARLTEIGTRAKQFLQRQAAASHLARQWHADEAQMPQLGSVSRDPVLAAGIAEDEAVI